MKPKKKNEVHIIITSEKKTVEECIIIWIGKKRDYTLKIMMKMKEENEKQKN